MGNKIIESTLNQLKRSIETSSLRVFWEHTKKEKKKKMGTYLFLTHQIQVLTEVMGRCLLIPNLLIQSWKFLDGHLFLIRTNKSACVAFDGRLVLVQSFVTLCHRAPDPAIVWSQCRRPLVVTYRVVVHLQHLVCLSKSVPCSVVFMIVV